MKDQYRSPLFIKNVTAPLFVIHGTEDRVIPVAQVRGVFAMANEPKQFIEVKGVGHEMIGDQATWHEVLRFSSSSNLDWASIKKNCQRRFQEQSPACNDRFSFEVSGVAHICLKFALQFERL